MKIKFLALIILSVTFSCKYSSKKKMFSNDIDTLLEKKLETYPTAVEVDDELTKIRSEVDIKIDSLKKLYHDDVNLAGNKFNTVVGSFKISENAQRYQMKMEELGHKALIINGNGFNMVAVKSYNNLRQAVNELDQYRSSITPNAWIYIKK